MLGWSELTRLVASVYTALPPWERAEVVLVGNNDDPLLDGYAEVREVARFDHPWMVREERDRASPDAYPSGALAVTRRSELTRRRLAQRAFPAEPPHGHAIGLTETRRTSVP